MSGFPTRFPIFPLPNVVLFPETRLPLYLFEPRYRAMMQAALDADRVIGMVLIRPNEDAVQPRAPVFEVGCAGPITEWSRLDDGCYTLLLRGERRFRVVREELAPGGFRVAEVELLEDASGALELADLESRRPRLEELVLEVARRAAPQAVEQMRAQMAALDATALVHALAFALDYAPLEKQGLLEARDPIERTGLLIRMLEFRRAELQLQDPSRSVH